MGVAVTYLVSCYIFSHVGVSSILGTRCSRDKEIQPLNSLSIVLLMWWLVKEPLKTTFSNVYVGPSGRTFQS